MLLELKIILRNFTSKSSTLIPNFSFLIPHSSFLIPPRFLKRFFIRHVRDVRGKFLLFFICYLLFIICFSRTPRQSGKDRTLPLLLRICCEIFKDQNTFRTQRDAVIVRNGLVPAACF